MSSTAHAPASSPDCRADAWVLDDAGGAAMGMATHWFDIASAAASWIEVANRTGLSVP